MNSVTMHLLDSDLCSFYFCTAKHWNLTAYRRSKRPRSSTQKNCAFVARKSCAAAGPIRKSGHFFQFGKLKHKPSAQTRRVIRIHHNSYSRHIISYNITKAKKNKKSAAHKTSLRKIIDRQISAKMTSSLQASVRWHGYTACLYHVLGKDSTTQTKLCFRPFG